MRETRLRILAWTLRRLITPWKLFLRYQVRSTLAKAEAAADPNAVPKMKTVGSPAVRLVGEPTAAQVADFVRHRSPAYVGPMSDEVADAFALMLLGKDGPKAFDAEQMNRMMMHSPSAYVAERQGDQWVFDFSKLNLHTLRKVTIVKYQFHAETGEAAITDAWGNVHQQGDALFDRALLHTMCWWNHYIHSGLHNWVHFHLPDTMLEAHASLTDKGSVLARLIAPHVRFTARINYAGLWLNQSTDNGPSLRKRLKPWGAGRTDAKGFQQGIIENTGQNYADLAAHFSRPDTLDTRVPFLAFLVAWFPSIERFVTAVDPHIEPAAWEELLTVLEKGTTTIRRIDRIRLLSEFIWQVAVLHVTDHLSYVRFAYPHGFHWVPETLDEPFELSDVRRYDRFKTRSFFNVFVRYNGVPGVKSGLLHVDNYRFTEAPLRQAAEAFRADLLEVDAQLEAADNRILRADELLQSVCF